MFGLSPQNAWLAVFLVFSAGAFIATARWSHLFARDRSLILYSIGFSLAFMVAAVLAGLSLFR